MLLLDTHAALWIGEGLPLAPEAIEAIEAAAAAGAVLVSPISAWEIGMLVAKGRLTLALLPQLWFDTFLGRPGVRLTPFTATAAIASAFLPAPFHADPADRLLVATARDLRLPLVTRDARILAFAKAGHLQALAC